MQEVWVEKYRPKSLDEVIDQQEVVSRLKAYVKTGNLPHLLFAGPAGTGKTTCAIALARELFGEDWRANFAETNASVAPETPCLIRRFGRIERTTFGDLSKAVFREKTEKYAQLENVDILSVDQRFHVRFLPATYLSRHLCKELVTIRYEGGQVRTSPDHSVMVFGAGGSLVPKAARDLKPGDHLISFAEPLPGTASPLNLEAFAPRPFGQPGQPMTNPKPSFAYANRRLKEPLSWLMGLYLAEGCSWMHRGDTSGGLVFTLGYPQDLPESDRAVHDLQDEFGLNPTVERASSGFDRTRMTSLQIRAANTQLARFFRHHFYMPGRRKTARAKRVPHFIFASEPEVRKSFLKGYMGDATGEWGRYVRYASRSQQALIDVAWLARLVGLHSSVFREEARILWPTESPGASYLPDLIPSAVVHEMFHRLGINAKYFLRHSLYYKKSQRISRHAVRRYLTSLGSLRGDIIAARIRRLIDSNLYPVLVKDVRREPYDDYVYDVSVPGSETFWGGTTPVLLHNSDARGIDVIRTTIKNQARMAPIGQRGFKVLFLDEADHLTADAQAALRRTMEMYTRTARFIISVNYSSRIIPPIQSRCALFRFRPLRPEHVKEYVARIAKAEGLKVTEDGMEAIVYIAQGDLRKATNALQVAAALSKVIDSDSLYRAAGAARPEDVRRMVETALKGDFLGARSMLDELLIEFGLAGEDLLREVYRAVYDLSAPDELKVRMVDRIGEADFRLIQGSNERIQLEALLSSFALMGKELT
jgi:replication factor C small subunit